MMNICFHIDYRTTFGEELVVVFDKMKGLKGADAGAPQYRMTTEDGEHWHADLRLDARSVSAVDYHYAVERDGEVLRHEWLVAAHRLELDHAKGENYMVYDHWTDVPEDSYLYSSAFTECVARRPQGEVTAKGAPTPLVQLKVRAPQLRSDERLAIAGGDEQLGAWDVRRAVPMTEHSHNEWVVNLDGQQLNRTLEFKFIVQDEEADVTPIWEFASNRTVELPSLGAGDVVVYELPQAFFPIHQTKCAGTLVPVFSLRSEGSFGVGDFGDLRLMTDWVAQTRQRVLQVLPINDTTITHTWTDSYPYSCISIFALHPQYADFRQLPPIEDEAQRTKFESLRKELNALPQIDYERVNNAKTEYLRVLFAQEGKKTLQTQDFKRFFEENKQWLAPYAQYCLLRDTTGTADHRQWKGHTTFDEADRKALESTRSKLFKEVAFYYYVQFVLNRQMEAAHEHARTLGVILKGDIPIGVNRYGCDVWQEPRYFNLNGQAGAPPDDFSVNGQNWGFPTYNWDEMVKDGCQWWVRRFTNMAKYFDAYRIDHVLGFFRIWEIPTHAVHGLLGQFQPSLGMTREEIEGYGLQWREELFLEPYITDAVLDRLFADKADMVRQQFVVPTHDGFYRMRKEYDTQRKVEEAFEGKTSEEDTNLRDTLYALISDVLFVRDHKDANKFHPRISVQFDLVYESLSDNDKYVFNRLYNDYYYRRNNQFWYREAMKKLPRLVQATRMLVCAEDLGMVPECVPWVMNELRILSLELQSMPKDPTTRFGHLSRNPYRSVCTISSHDMPTLRQWWDEDEQRTQEYYNTMLYRGGAAPHPLPGWLAGDIVSRHLTSPSMLCILSIQDWLATDEKLRLPDANAERINIPANPRHYWRYRMHLTMEQLLASTEFNENIKELIIHAGRK